MKRKKERLYQLYSILFTRRFGLMSVSVFILRLAGINFFLTESGKFCGFCTGVYFLQKQIFEFKLIREAKSVKLEYDIFRVWGKEN